MVLSTSARRCGLNPSIDAAETEAPASAMALAARQRNVFIFSPQARACRVDRPQKGRRGKRLRKRGQLVGGGGGRAFVRGDRLGSLAGPVLVEPGDDRRRLGRRLARPRSNPAVARVGNLDEGRRHALELERGVELLGFAVGRAVVLAAYDDEGRSLDV